MVPLSQPKPPESSKPQWKPPVMTRSCVGAGLALYIFSWWSVTPATVSLLPPTYWAGTVRAAEAVTADGLVSAAASVVTVRTAGLREAASRGRAPPTEWPDGPSRAVSTLPLKGDPVVVFCAVSQ